MDEKDLDEKYMKEALKQAQKAYAINEVPIGLRNSAPRQNNCKRV